jgi:hypothetical protein
MLNKNDMKNTRDVLAYIWTFSVIIMVMYVLIRFGDDKNILMLLVGFITGTASSPIFGTYFSMSAKASPPAGTTEKPLVADVTIKEEKDKEE